MKKIVSLLCLILLSVSTLSAQGGSMSPREKGKKTPVRNLIYMIGDGMGLAHVSMLAIEDKYEPNSFDRATNIALISTYSANNRVTDSAAAGTALATGYKTNNGTLGQTPEGEAVTSIIAHAEQCGLQTGLVVTSSLLHATPAAFYAHVASRKEEPTIARQFTESGIDVAIGGGSKVLRSTKIGERSILECLSTEGYVVVDELDKAADVHQGRLFAACADDHMPSMMAGRGEFLPQAVDKALEILSANTAKSRKGFVLMVEGSQIDMESHGNKTEGILAEMRDFERAIAVAMDFADRNPGTLVVVCADHETGGLSMPSNNRDFTESESGIKYCYGTGSHTGIMVPVYLYGSGAEMINGVMDNTELSMRLAEIMQVK